MRPTSDRLKETLFNILGPSLPGSGVLDVFAGTGAIGLEALSRGAREVVFIESSREGCRLIRENLGLCGVTMGFRHLNCDVFSAFHSLARSGFCFDTVFLDPPYEWQSYGDLLEVLFGTRLVHGRSSVVMEHHRKSRLPEEGGEYCRVRVVRQSDKCLSFYSFKVDTNPSSHHQL